jgi:hypothetical protein
LRWPRGRRGQPSLTARVTLPPVGANEDAARALIIEVGGRCRGSSASKLLCGDNSHHSALCVENGHGRDGLVARRKPNSLRESVHALLTPIALDTPAHVDAAGRGELTERCHADGGSG